MWDEIGMGVYHLIIVEWSSIVGEELKIGLHYIKVWLKYLDRPVGDIKCNKKKSYLVVDLDEYNRESEYCK
jgi:hypothetical protein